VCVVFAAVGLARKNCNSTPPTAGFVQQLCCSMQQSCSLHACDHVCCGVRACHHIVDPSVATDAARLVGARDVPWAACRIHATVEWTCRLHVTGRFPVVVGSLQAAGVV
jgi:hypothetical protein